MNGNCTLLIIIIPIMGCHSLSGVVLSIIPYGTDLLQFFYPF